ncbi:hypothetical protein C8R44DRAFT_338959 [Mycena epipterygia]|nr:hypothetical protein C8R44DRAFT_338959 [Mycena epipterygia]
MTSRSDSKMAKIDTRDRLYTEHCAAPDLPQLPFPKLHLYFELDDSGTRQCLDGDVRYDGIRLLACELLSHLAGSTLAHLHLLRVFRNITLGSSAAKAALQETLGESRALKSEDIAAFLNNDTPSIVFKELKGSGRIIWGQVVKGEDAGAAENTLFISWELTKAMRDAPPPELSLAEMDTQRNNHNLIFSVTYLHELVHSLSKHFFANIVTPSLASLEKDGEGNGEAGGTFELAHFGFTLQVSWKPQDAADTQRMWRIAELVAKMKGQCRVLTDTDILRVQRSFKKESIWQFKAGELEPYLHNNNSRVRFRAGPGYSVEMEEEAGEGVSGVDNRFYAITCAPRPSGFGLALDPQSLT